MPLPARIHCTSPGLITLKIAEAVDVMPAPLQQIGQRLQAGMSMGWRIFASPGASGTGPM